MIHKLLGSKLLAAAYLALISFLFLLPGSAIPGQGWFSIPHVDKIVHVVFFALLVFLFVNAFNLNTKMARAIVFLLSISYGSVIEIVQDEYVANRGADVWDIMADAGGSILGLIAVYLYKKNKPL